MKRWNLSKIERLGSWPKVSHISTTSNYSGSQSLSSIWEIQFSIFFLNFLKQNWKWNSKIERHGSWPKVSHISTTSNYSGSQTFSKFGDIQFSIKNNMKEHVAAVHEEMKPFKNWMPRILAKSVPHQHNIKLFWLPKFEQYLRHLIFNLQISELKHWPSALLIIARTISCVKFGRGLACLFTDFSGSA